MGVVPRALPNQPDASMKELSKGALERSLRLRAKAERHRQALFRSKVALASQRARDTDTNKRVAELEAKLRAERHADRTPVRRAALCVDMEAGRREMNEAHPGVRPGGVVIVAKQALASFLPRLRVFRHTDRRLPTLPVTEGAPAYTLNCGRLDVVSKSGVCGAGLNR